MNALILRAALILVPAAMLIAACGGDDDGDGGSVNASPLSEEEYFQQMEALMQETDDVLEQELEVPTGVEPEEEARERFARQNEFVAQTFEDLSDDLAELAPPSAFDLLHGEVRDALVDYARNLRAFAGFVRASVGEDTETGEIGETVAAAYDRLATLCAALEAAASRYDVEIDLTCSADSSARNGDTIDIAPGVRGRLAPMPPLPDGLTAVSDYIEFEQEGDPEAAPAVIGLPLTEPVEDAGTLAWYSYDGGEWTRLDNRVVLEQEGTVAQGDFESIPPGLAVLREDR